MLVLHKPLKTVQRVADFPASLPSHLEPLLKNLTSPRKSKGTQNATLNVMIPAMLMQETGSYL